MRPILILIRGVLSRSIKERALETGISYKEQARIALILGMCEIAKGQRGNSLKEFIGKVEE